VLLTHLHVDHVGGLDAVPAARVLTTAEELRYARAPDSWMEPEYPAASRTLDPRRVRVVDDGHDVFSDGTVVVVATPGHTPGHVSVLLHLPETGAVLLPGDAAWTRRTLLDDAAVPGLLWDEPTWQRSRRRLRRLVAEHEARVFYTHEPDQFSAATEDWRSGEPYR
jgi:glyoxylase-like metal-dependent hydrolase (beta-lactamase superfamily II)